MSPIPDERALRTYLDALYGQHPDAFVEIAHRWRRGDRAGGMRRGAKGGLFLPTRDLDQAAREITRLGTREEVWVGVLPRRPDPETGEIGGTSDFVAPGRVLWVDADLKDCPDALDRLRAFRPTPQMVVASGGGYHAYWLLSHELDRDAIVAANRRLAHALGADQAATDAARILRPPATSNFKYDPSRRVELIGFSSRPRYAAASVVGTLGDPPGTKPPRSRRARSHADLAADPIRAIPPPEYFPALVRTTVPASGFVNCPLPDHDDPDPSCRVWEAPDRGWYCFGCRRGGDIYELAGLIWGLSRRGQSFLEIRRRLTRLFGTNERPAGARRGGPGRPRPQPPPGSAPPAPSTVRDGPRGSAPTALLDPPRPRTAVPEVGEAADADVPAGPGVGDDVRRAAAPDERAIRRVTRSAPPSTRADAPSLAPILLVVGVALAGMTVFLAVFAVLGGSQPEAGEPFCAPSANARDGIPPRYLRLYQDAGRSYGLDWAVLAAIGLIESGHGANVGPSSAGARGPMQFMPGTWTSYGVDGNGDGRKDVMDPEDAIPGAARYLKASGAPGNWRRAIFAYNHADWYVRDVLAQAERYRADCVPGATWSPGSGRLSWPVRGSVTSPFGIRWGRLHAGIDIASPAGTPVHSASAGRVVLRQPTAGYGNYVCVQHLARISTCYAHLSAFRTRRGRQVQRGDVIGLVGCTGHCFGDHLHFEVRRGGAGGEPVDPMPYIEERP